MAIVRIEEVTYGVLDVEQCCKFLIDAGLVKVAARHGVQRFRTLTNQIVQIVPHDEGSLPAARAAAPTVREVTWGVRDDADLDIISDELSQDRPVWREGAGLLRSHDQTGFGIAFRKATPETYAPEIRKFNRYGAVERPSGEHCAYGRPKPIRLIHIALDIPKEGHDVATAFYVDRLGFKPVDEISPTGTFLQCEGETDHHQLFLCHRTDRAGINHIAFEVRDFDEVIEGGNYLAQCGWKEARRLGRHTIGSNMFRFFHAPLGGRIEYVTDMDQVPKSAPPRRWETSPEHHLWMIKSPGDS